MAAPQDDALTSERRLLRGERKSQFEDGRKQLQKDKEVVNHLRKENKDLKKELLAIKDEKDQEKDGAISGYLDDRKLVQLDNKINSVRRQIDASRNKRRRQEVDIQRIRERCDDIDKIRPDILDEKQWTDTLARQSDGLNKKIQMLENRLDKSMIKFNEAQAIRKTYEQIVRRLKEERIGFDNQLAAIERTLKAKDHDYQELLNMSHDANHANAISKAELGQFRAAYEEERRQKDLELSERKMLVQKRIDQTQKLEKREKQLKAKEAEADKPKQEEEKPKLAAVEPAPEEQEKLAQYEKYFQDIKEATGVQDGDVSTVIEKFINQRDTHQNLTEMKDTAQKRIDQLTQEKGNLKLQLDEIKYSGSGQLGSRRIVDEFEAHLADARHQCEKNRVKYERAARVLINVKAGIDHLADKLQDFKRDRHSEMPDDGRPAMGDESVVKVMEYCKKKIEDVLAFVTEEGFSHLDDLGVPASDVVLPQTNRRIKLPTSDDEEDNGDDEDEDEEEDVLDRETVKKLATLALDREKKKSKKRGKKANKE